MRFDLRTARFRFVAVFPVVAASAACLQTGGEWNPPEDVADGPPETEVPLDADGDVASFEDGDDTDDDAGDFGDEGGGGVCGDLVAGGDEECDGDDLRGLDCERLGRAPGMLSCGGDCRYDLTGCPVIPVCGNLTAEGDEECDGGDVRGNDCETLGLGSGDLTCGSGCRYDVSGCLGCSHACAAVGDRRCVENARRQCVVGSEGCRVWSVEIDCAAAGKVCVPSAEGPACIGGAAGTCAEPRVAAGLPTFLSGGDMTAAFGDHSHFRGTGCGAADGVEAVIARWMTAGETLRLKDAGGIDLILRVLAQCSDAAPCLASRDEPEDPGVFFTAPVDGTYFFVAESFWAAPTARAYAVTLDRPPTGNLCSDPIPAASLPVTRAGGDFHRDFTDDHVFSGPGCFAAEGPEAILARTMAAGETVRLRETGGIDVVLRVLSACDAAAFCLAARDEPETPGLTFTAPVAGTYYFVVESRWAAPPARAYSFVLEDAPDGNLCTDPAAGGTLPTTLTGGDMLAAFTDDHRFTGPGCTVVDGVEAVFGRAMRAGETVRLRETGGIDVILRVVTSCVSGAPCLAERNEPEDPGLTFTAPADGNYLFVAEATSAAPVTRGYSITLDRPRAGNLCTDPYVVSALPAEVSGGDFFRDVTDDHVFGGAGCTAAAGPEMIFVRDMLAGENVRVSETGAIDVVIRLLDGCGPTARCVVSQDDPESPGPAISIPSDGTWFFVVESRFASTGSRGYRIRFETP